MNHRVQIQALTALVCAALLGACATQPSPTAPTANAPSTTNTTNASKPPPPPGQRRYKWSRASEAEVAAALDKKFQEAAKSFVQLKRDDQLMFCKNYRDIGSNVRRLHCITE